MPRHLHCYADVSQASVDQLACPHTAAAAATQPFESVAASKAGAVADSSPHTLPHVPLHHIQAGSTHDLARCVLSSGRRTRPRSTASWKLHSKQESPINPPDRTRGLVASTSQVPDRSFVPRSQAVQGNAKQVAQAKAFKGASNAAEALQGAANFRVKLEEQLDALALEAGHAGICATASEESLVSPIASKQPDEDTMQVRAALLKLLWQIEKKHQTKHGSPTSQPTSSNDFQSTFHSSGSAESAAWSLGEHMQADAAASCLSGLQPQQQCTTRTESGTIKKQKRRPHLASCGYRDVAAGSRRTSAESTNASTGDQQPLGMLVDAGGLPAPVLVPSDGSSVSGRGLSGLLRSASRSLPRRVKSMLTVGKRWVAVTTYHGPQTSPQGPQRSPRSSQPSAQSSQGGAQAACLATDVGTLLNTTLSSNAVSKVASEDYLLGSSAGCVFRQPAVFASAQGGCAGCQHVQQSSELYACSSDAKVAARDSNQLANDQDQNIAAKSASLAAERSDVPDLESASGLGARSDALRVEQGEQLHACCVVHPDSIVARWPEEPQKRAQQGTSFQEVTNRATSLQQSESPECQDGNATNLSQLQGDDLFAWEGLFNSEELECQGYLEQQCAAFVGHKQSAGDAGGDALYGVHPVSEWRIAQQPQNMAQNNAAGSSSAAALAPVGHLPLQLTDGDQLPIALGSAEQCVGREEVQSEAGQVKCTDELECRSILPDLENNSRIQDSKEAGAGVAALGGNGTALDCKESVSDGEEVILEQGAVQLECEFKLSGGQLSLVQNALFSSCGADRLERVEQHLESSQAGSSQLLEEKFQALGVSSTGEQLRNVIVQHNESVNGWQRVPDNVSKCNSIYPHSSSPVIGETDDASHIFCDLQRSCIPDDQRFVIEAEQLRRQHASGITGSVLHDLESVGVSYMQLYVHAACDFDNVQAQAVRALQTSRQRTQHRACAYTGNP